MGCLPKAYQYSCMVAVLSCWTFFACWKQTLISSQEGLVNVDIPVPSADSDDSTLSNPLRESVEISDLSSNEETQTFNEFALVFFHISKTAGTATLKTLQEMMDQRELSQSEREDATMRWLSTTKPGSFVWHHSPAAACDNDWCRAQRPVWFTVWRDPVERILSQYFYVRHADRGKHKEEKRARLQATDKGIVSCVLKQEEGCRRNWMTAMLCGHSSFCRYTVFNKDDRLAEKAYHSAEQNLKELGFVLHQSTLGDDLKSMFSKLQPHGEAPPVPKAARVTVSRNSTSEADSGEWVSGTQCPRWKVPREHCEMTNFSNETTTNNGKTLCISMQACHSLIKSDPAIMAFLRRANQMDIQLNEIAIERNAELRQLESIEVTDILNDLDITTVQSAKCPPGHFHDVMQVDGRCTACPVGTFMSQGESFCQPCRNGTAQAREGGTECIACDPNQAEPYSRWTLGHAFCPRDKNWAETTSLPSVDCKKLEDFRQLTVSFKHYVKQIFTAVYQGRKVIVMIQGDKPAGFAAGFDRAAQMSSTGLPYFPKVLAVCSDYSESHRAGYITEFVDDAVTIDEVSTVFARDMHERLSLRKEPAELNRSVYGLHLSIARQYASAILHMENVAPRWPSPIGRPLVYCDQQLKHMIISRSTGKLSVIDLDDAPIAADNGGNSAVPCNPGPDEGLGYARKDSYYTRKRHAWKFCYFARPLFFTSTSRNSTALPFLEQLDDEVVRLRRLFDSCYEHNDALRPRLDMIYDELTNIALRSKTLPLVQLHVPLSGGSELGSVLGASYQNISWWHRHRGETAALRKFPSFAGRTTWGWRCGLHVGLKSFRECLENKFGLVESDFSFSWITVLSDPLIRVAREYIACCERNQCADTGCAADDSSVESFVFHDSTTTPAPPQSQRQLWMISGWTQEKCMMDQAACLASAKRNLDGFLFIIYEDFERGVDFLEKRLDLDIPDRKRRLNSDVTRILSQIDASRFEGSFAGEIELYRYAVRRFEVLVSPSHAFYTA